MIYCLRIQTALYYENTITTESIWNEKYLE